MKRNYKIIISIILIAIIVPINVSSLRTIEKNLNINDSKLTTIEEMSYNNIEWIKTYGGKGSDICWAIEKTTDNGFIIVGETSTFGHGSSDVWIIKIDQFGNEEWNKTFGGKKNDYGFQGIQTKDGGYIIVGGTKSFGAGDHDTWLIKTDENGNEKWNVSYGGSERDQGYSIKQTFDGGYIICGGSSSYGLGPNDYWIIKTDVNGHELWNITYGTKGYDWGYDIIETSDGGFLFTGGTDKSFRGIHILDVGLIRIDNNGNIQWAKSYNKPPSWKRWDEGYGLVKTDDEGYIIAGIAHTYSWSETGEGDGWIIKTDSNGKKLWDKTYGGLLCDCFSSVQMTNDNGYILSGWTYSFGEGDADMWLMKIDDIGREKWDMTLGGNKYEWSMLHTLQQTSDNCYLIVGTTYSFGIGNNDILLVKVAEPSIEIDIEAGLGLSMIVRNIDLEDLMNINWSIDIYGMVFAGTHQEGFISVLPAGGEMTISSTSFLLGIGPVIIRVTVGDIGYIAKGVFIGPYCLLIK